MEVYIIIIKLNYIILTLGMYTILVKLAKIIKSTNVDQTTVKIISFCAVIKYLLIILKKLSLLFHYRLIDVG